MRTKQRCVGAMAVCGLAAFHAFGLAFLPEAQASQPTPNVRVFGVYEGTYPPGGRAHRFGFHPAGAVTVKVGTLNKRVLLVLTAYEPVVWNIQASKGALVQVIATGYYRQTVKGLDPEVPVTRLSY